MTDVKSIVFMVLGAIVFVILILFACSSRARVIQMAVRERILEGRRYQPDSRSTRTASVRSTAQPAGDCRRNTSESELPKYEPPPPAYAPAKIVVHGTP